MSIMFCRLPYGDSSQRACQTHQHHHLSPLREVESPSLPYPPASSSSSSSLSLAGGRVSELAIPTSIVFFFIISLPCGRSSHRACNTHPWGFGSPSLPYPPDSSSPSSSPLRAFESLSWPVISTSSPIVFLTCEDSSHRAWPVHGTGRIIISLPLWGLESPSFPDPFTSSSYSYLLGLLLSRNSF
ncbi:hypothetical protein Patl1_12282 [Pistacia atlantica]|uniref:Uncharacterized protein n=1 Tax=Pistacia atlantica TaxID=434234 RepID=A0ACC1A2B6_9ROSI|nr:hypothetical protein Patl1_12282 [Pistacia atlantica]